MIVWPLDYKSDLLKVMSSEAIPHVLAFYISRPSDQKSTSRQAKVYLKQNENLSLADMIEPNGMTPMLWLY